LKEQHQEEQKHDDEWREPELFVPRQKIDELGHETALRRLRKPLEFIPVEMWHGDPRLKVLMLAE
jgi:hypothetical protein